jgi:hypothetical protein
MTGQVSWTVGYVSWTDTPSPLGGVLSDCPVQSKRKNAPHSSERALLDGVPRAYPVTAWL